MSGCRFLEGHIHCIGALIIRLQKKQSNWLKFTAVFGYFRNNSVQSCFVCCCFLIIALNYGCFIAATSRTNSNSNHKPTSNNSRVRKIKFVLVLGSLAALMVLVPSSWKTKVVLWRVVTDWLLRILTSRKHLRTHCIPSHVFIQLIFRVDQSNTKVNKN